jgi:hypothetical protein
MRKLFQTKTALIALFIAIPAPLTAWRATAPRATARPRRVADAEA